jgi:hypothetical protein
MHELHNATTPNYSILPPETGVEAAVNFDTKEATANITVYGESRTETGTVHEVSPPNRIERTAASYVDNIRSLETDEYREARRARYEEALRERRIKEQRKRDLNHEVRIVQSVRTNGDRTYRLRPATPDEIKQVALYGSRRTADEHNRLILDAPVDGPDMSTRHLDVTLRITQAPEDVLLPDGKGGSLVKRVPAGTALLQRKGRIEHRIPLEDGTNGKQTYRIDHEHVNETAMLAGQEAIDALISTNPPTEYERRMLAEENAREKKRQAQAFKYKWLGLVAAGALVAVSVADIGAQLVGQQAHQTKPPIHRQHTRTDQSHATDTAEASGETTILLTAQVTNDELWSFEAEQLNMAEPGLKEQNPTLFNTKVLAWVRASEGLPSNSAIQNYRHMSEIDSFTAYTAAAMMVYDKIEHPPVGPPSEGGSITPSAQKNAQDVVELDQAFTSLEQLPVEGDGLNDQKDAKAPVVKAATQKIGKLLQKFATIITLKTN